MNTLIKYIFSIFVLSFPSLNLVTTRTLLKLFPDPPKNQQIILVIPVASVKNVAVSPGILQG